MFGNLFKKNAPLDVPNEGGPAPTYLVAHLNARLQPADRAELFEDPLDAALQALGIGSVGGVGSWLSDSGEVGHCDIEIDVAACDGPTLQTIIGLLDQLGAPRGSTLEAGGNKLPFGVTEGMAIYLNGTDLPDEVYKACDANVVYSELERLAADYGEIYSYWQTPAETAFYLYGNAFEAMHDSVAEFLATYPLCQKCRVEQIA
jgi:hypothetical protein